jgi:hypothetical protein
MERDHLEELGIRRGADVFLFAAQPKRIFLGWVKDVRTTKS